ncbi:hypothetical protein IM660_03475 [Ruania alkalisoli]|uniref:Uncharacterized protein n=1 Tax=Ruania alkalisoli TaxID=2779775 RepID=A0A7M1SXL8_9MICO|nr:hypothetical protein [Ruania alkalisoli]QOR71373.1 hypothetical protein IM660_03475 [Ruania alkalisoli]
MHVGQSSTAQAVSGLSLTGGEGWTAALAVRDALRLPWSADVPVLEPAVPTRSGGAADVSERDWFAWLRQVADAPRSRPVPHHSAPLREAQRQVRPSLQEHEEIWDRQVADLADALRDVLSGAIAGGGRITYLIQIVPVAGAWSLDVSAAHLLASPAALATPDARRELLGPRLRRAVTG